MIVCVLECFHPFAAGSTIGVESGPLERLRVGENLAVAVAVIIESVEQQLVLNTFIDRFYFTAHDARLIDAAILAIAKRVFPVCSLVGYEKQKAARQFIDLDPI